jgi:DNA-binding response OmpR family regulator
MILCLPKAAMEDNAALSVECAGIKVVLIGPRARHDSRIHRLLCAAGAHVESTDRDDGRTGRSGIDLIVLDLAGNLKPLQWLSRWRKEGMETSVLVVADVEEAVACFEAGANDCIPESIDPRELAARMYELSRRVVSNRRMVRIHDLEIDTEERSVRRANQPIRLTRREFALLELLASYPGKVVTRSVIWKRLYRDRMDMPSNIVDVYIRYLRKKIDDGFDLPLILTCRGQGYLLRGMENPPD